MRVLGLLGIVTGRIRITPRRYSIRFASIAVVLSCRVFFGGLTTCNLDNPTRTHTWTWRSGLNMVDPLDSLFVPNLDSQRVSGNPKTEASTGHQK